MPAESGQNEQHARRLIDVAHGIANFNRVQYALANTARCVVGWPVKMHLPGDGFFEARLVGDRHAADRDFVLAQDLGRLRSFDEVANREAAVDLGLVGDSWA